jgi:HEAT repeat protein
MLVRVSASRARSLLLHAAEDSDPEVRLGVAQAILVHELRDAAPLVRPWLQERDARLRAAACDVLRSFSDAANVPLLARALGDVDPSVRSAAADALSTQGSDDAVTPLLGRIDDSSPAVRVQIARSLARIGDERAVVPTMGKLQDSAPEVRQAALRALSDLGAIHAAPAIMMALRDAVAEVRFDAIRALGRLRAREATGVLGALALDRTATIRAAALAALGRIGTPEAAAAATGAVGHFEDATAELEGSPVRDALVAMGESARKSMVDLLERARARSAHLTAAYVLARLPRPSRAARGSADPDATLDALMRAFRRGALPPAAWLRAIALQAAPPLLPAALEWLDDKTPSVRAEARAAVSAILEESEPDGRVFEPLAAALRRRPLGMEERVELLRLTGSAAPSKAARQLVRSYLNYPNVAVQLAAIGALARLGGPHSAIAEMLESPDREVRAAAANALRQSGDGDAGRLLARALTTGAYPWVREGVPTDARAAPDRDLILRALAGIVTRTDDGAAPLAVREGLPLADPREHDAMLEVLGRAKSSEGESMLTQLARSEDVYVRRAVALALGGRSKSERMTALLELIRDADASVRAHAALSLVAPLSSTDGRSAGGPGSRPWVDAVRVLETLARDGTADEATNATYTLARIFGKASDPSAATARLCPLLEGRHPYAVANALAGLARANARCGDGDRERHLLLHGSHDVVRTAAARTLSARPKGPAEARLLEQCAVHEPSVPLAEACAGPARKDQRRSPSRASGSGADVPTRGATPATSADGTAWTILIVPFGRTTPAPGAAFALGDSDGFVRVGVADRRGGAVVASDPTHLHTPTVRLLEPTAWVVGGAPESAVRRTGSSP